METTELMAAITTVGFPVVMCMIMSWYVYFLNNKHMEEMEKITESVHNNTLALQELCEQLRK